MAEARTPSERLLRACLWLASEAARAGQIKQATIAVLALVDRLGKGLPLQDADRQPDTPDRATTPSGPWYLLARGETPSE